MANLLPQLPRMLDAPRAPEVLVAAEHDQRLEAVMGRLVGVAETEVERMLAGEERHDVGGGDIGAEVGDQMAQVVLLLRAHRTVGDHHPHVLPRQPSDGVVDVNPCVDVFVRLQLRPRDAERLLAQLEAKARRLPVAAGRETVLALWIKGLKAPADALAADRVVSPRQVLEVLR